jgi:hypothetical protein
VVGACELYARLAGGPEGECGAVWLHVIGYNTAAISLYERVGFQVQPSFIPLVCWPVLVVKLKEGCRGGGGAAEAQAPACVLQHRWRAIRCLAHVESPVLITPTMIVV